MYYKSSEEETIKPHREGFSHSPFSSLSNHTVALGFDLDHVRWAIKDHRLAILNPNFPFTSHRLMRNLLPQLHRTHPRFPSSMFSPSRSLLFWTFLQLSSQILALTIGGSCCPAGLKTLHVPESTFQVGLKAKAKDRAAGKNQWQLFWQSPTSSSTPENRVQESHQPRAKLSSRLNKSSVIG